LKTLKEKRQEAEKDAAKKNQTLPYPTHDQFRTEAEEQKPEVYFMVYDESGAPIRRVNADVGEGFHQATWDLRYFAPVVPEGGGGGDDDFPPASNQGPLVLPGKYSARLFKRVDGVITPLGDAQSFSVVTDATSTLSAADRSAQQDFTRKVARLYRSVSGAINTANELKDRLKDIRKALLQTPGADAMTAEADAIEKQNNEILRALRGDVAIAARNENIPSSINDRLTYIMEGARFSITAPTKTQTDAYAIASDEFSGQLSKLKTLVQVDLAKLEKEMEAAGAPWTPGRLPE